ncbi:MAG TPA: hypothetical protein VIO14_14440 [Dehalococcoidia bacterium]
MTAPARTAFWLTALAVLAGTGALILWAVRRGQRTAAPAAAAPRAPAAPIPAGVRPPPDEPAPSPVAEAGAGEPEEADAPPVPEQAALRSRDGRWETWAPRVPVRHVTSVVLAIRAVDPDGDVPGVLACHVRDPEGGGTNSAVQVRGGGWHYVRYPHDFFGAGLHRPGEYRVTWLAGQDGPAVARDRFEVIL